MYYGPTSLFVIRLLFLSLLLGPNRLAQMNETNVNIFVQYALATK